jgi:ABC-type lipoprotein export system ATPase subunit
VTSSAPAHDVTSAMVVLEDVSRVIRTRAGDSVILDSVSFAAARGGLFGIIGPSGSGKSTLLNIVSGIDRPAAGRVTVAGRGIESMTDSQRARWRAGSAGVVFQFIHLFPELTVQENVLVALELGRIVPRELRKDRATECLRVVGMEHLAATRADDLSRGLQQMAAIARALANDPPVILADEPTGNLTSRSGQDVFERLKDLTALGKTVLYATHDRDLGLEASDHIELLDGRVASRSYGAVPGLYA